MKAVITLWLLAAVVAFVVIVGEWNVPTDCPTNITTIAKDQSRVGG